MHQNDVPRRVLLREILVLFAALFLPGIIAQSGTIDPGAFNNITYHVQTITIALAQSLLVLHVLSLHGDTGTERFGFVPLRLSRVAVGLAVGVGLILIVLPVGALEQVLSERSGNVTPGVRFRLERPELLPLVIPTSLAIGYREEVFFRAFLLPRLEDLGASPATAVIVSTAAFAVGHLYQGILGGVVAAAIGAVLAIVFLRRRDVHVVAVAHAAYNAAVLMTSYFIFS
ncbi:MAG: CPBP family intramembrane glutamic endopeptidase [bacterium]